MKTTSFGSIAIAAAVLGALGFVQPAGATLVTLAGTGTPLGNSIPVQIGGQTVLAFGLDVTKPLQFGVYEAELVDPANFANGQRAAWIYENYIGLAQAGAGLVVQLALWDVMNDGGNGLGAGLVQLGPSAPADVRFLGDLIIANSNGRSSGNATILRLTANGKEWQPLIVSLLEIEVLPPGSAEEVPEPGSALAMLVAGLGMGWRYHRGK
jgi:hypothetical protein